MENGKGLKEIPGAPKSESWEWERESRQNTVTKGVRMAFWRFYLLVLEIDMRKLISRDY